MSCMSFPWLQANQPGRYDLQYWNMIDNRLRHRRGLRISYTTIAQAAPISAIQRCAISSNLIKSNFLKDSAVRGISRALKGSLTWLRQWDGEENGSKAFSYIYRGRYDYCQRDTSCSANLMPQRFQFPLSTRPAYASVHTTNPSSQSTSISLFAPASNFRDKATVG